MPDATPSSVRLRRGLALASATAATLAFIAPSGAALAAREQEAKVTICHRTNATKNPYVAITAPVSAIDGINGKGEGKGDHFGEHTGPIWDASQPNGGDWGDIIPPIPGVHDGLNWTPRGQAILAAGCNAPSVTDDEWQDTDGDGTPDATDPDDDGDGTMDVVDPSEDTDEDGTPDANDSDDDGDGTPDASDSDDDGDGTPDASDPDADPDGDGDPNATDPDDDSDGIVDEKDKNVDTDGDRDPDVSDPDDDSDGTPDVSDSDDDGDGTPDLTDPDSDPDGDGDPNATDPDNDGDGIVDEKEKDFDSDGTPDSSDSDDDNDGNPDATDPDDDNDGTPENATDPDSDEDGSKDAVDPDDDNDGTRDPKDADDNGDGIDEVDEQRIVDPSLPDEIDPGKETRVGGPDDVTDAGMRVTYRVRCTPAGTTRIAPRGDIDADPDVPLCIVTERGSRVVVKVISADPVKVRVVATAAGVGTYQGLRKVFTYRVG